MTCSSKVDALTYYAILLQVYFKIVWEQMYTINADEDNGMRKPLDINGDASIHTLFKI